MFGTPIPHPTPPIPGVAPPSRPHDPRGSCGVCDAGDRGWWGVEGGGRGGRGWGEGCAVGRWGRGMGLHQKGQDPTHYTKLETNCTVPRTHYTKPQHIYQHNHTLYKTTTHKAILPNTTSQHLQTFETFCGDHLFPKTFMCPIYIYIFLKNLNHRSCGMSFSISDSESNDSDTRITRLCAQH